MTDNRLSHCGSGLGEYILLQLIPQSTTSPIFKQQMKDLTWIDTPEKEKIYLGDGLDWKVYILWNQNLF